MKNVEIMKKKHCGIDSLSSSSHQLAIRQNFLGELSKCLEFTQNQFSEELANKKKNLKKRNAKCVKNDLSDLDEVSSNLKELQNRSTCNKLLT